MTLTVGQKISLAKKGKSNGRLGIKHTKETKLKISQSEKGKKVSKETREKISKAKKGVKVSKETREKVSKSLKKYYDRVGRKNKRPYHKQDMAYKNWRLTVFKRDKYTCQDCGLKGCYLEAHHIKNYSNYPKLRTKLENGKTLCKKCHKLTDNYKGKAKKIKS